MALQLSGQSERLPALLRAQLGEQGYQQIVPVLSAFYGELRLRALDPHREFPGRVVDQMPLLISGKDEKGEVVDIPRDPASLAYTIERRETAPKDVIEAWQNNCVFTGDADLCDDTGANLIALDAQLLRELHGKSKLYRGAAVLPQSNWDELAAKGDALILSAEEVQEAHGKGYIKKNGVWVPANATIGKVWEGTDTFPGLARGRKLTSYIQLVAENSPRSVSLLNCYFNQTRQESSVTGRSWVAYSIDLVSNACGYLSLYNDCGRLVGVAPEALVAREKVLEARIQSALAARTEFTFNGVVWGPK